MDINMILTPVAGGIIGYFTNWLAIKMLFRPHEEKFIGKLKVPFTPGLIPKEKERISSTLGDTVGNYLLTKDVILEGFSNADVESSVEKIISEGFNILKLSDLTIEQAYSKLTCSSDEKAFDDFVIAIIEKLKIQLFQQSTKERISDILYFNLMDLLNCEIKDLDYSKVINEMEAFFLQEKNILQENGIVNKTIEKSIWNYLITLKDDERKLNDIISSSSSEELKDYLSVKIPMAVNALLNLAENEEIEKILKSKVADMIQSIAGPFMGMFINADDIYIRIVESITTYFNDAQNLPEIEKAADISVNKLLELTLGDMATITCGEIRENSLNRIIGFLLKEVSEDSSISAVFNNIIKFFENNDTKSLAEIINEFDNTFDEKIKIIINKSLDVLLSDYMLNNLVKVLMKELVLIKTKTIGDVLSNISENTFISLKSVILTIYKMFISKAAPKILEALNIPKIVEERINSFSTEYTEELILSIVNKELKAITAVGGVLGFVIGLFPVILNMI